jgi:hypothetical protein
VGFLNGFFNESLKIAMAFYAEILIGQALHKDNPENPGVIPDAQLFTGETTRL